MATTVHVVSDEWISDVREMDANLMGSPSSEFEFEQGVSVELFQHSINSLRRFPRVVVSDCVLFSNRRVLAEGKVDEIDVRFWVTVDESEIALLCLTILELLAKSPVRRIRFCRDHDAARVFVESMNDPGAGKVLADSRKLSARPILKVPRKSVDESSRLVAPRRMDDESRLLVDHDQVIVFEQDLKRDLFGGDFATRWRGKSRDDNITLSQLRTRLRNSSVDDHRIFLDQSLERRSAEKWNAIDEVSIQSLLKIMAERECHLDWMVVVGRG